VIRPQAGAAAWLALALAGQAQASGAAPATASSPAAAAGARPKVCLVLSGGGARGAAHVGVLKVLEELRVPVHCIAGTSMGALVGGGYASGMNTAEMQEMLASITTEKLFKERPPRQELSNRRKEDDYRSYIGPEFGVGEGKATFGKGIVSGVQLETFLREISRIKGFVRFDSLPIPYRAVATDLVTGKPVVFKEGELANVMRASMAVPGAVAPAEFDGMMLVDGMLTANLPVQVARDMGADVIIAVNVGTPLLKREELNGVLGVAGQMLNILTEQNVQASLAKLRPGDILISPDLEGFSTGDFDRLQAIAPRGEDAARLVADRLAALSIPPAEFAELRHRQRVAVAPDTLPVDEIRFPGLKRVNPASARAVMDTEPGKPIDQRTLDADMRRLYGTGDFEHVQYRILDEPARRVLAVDAVEKAWGPDYVRLGMGLSSDFSGNAYFNLLATHRRTWINSLGAEWRNDLQVGYSSFLTTEFYQPLNAEGTYFVAPSLSLGRRLTDIYSGDQRFARFNTTYALANLDVGANFRRFGEMRVGLQYGSVSPELDTGPPQLAPAFKQRLQGAYTARLLLDRLDSALFPRSGWRGGASAYNAVTQLGSENPYGKWEAWGDGAVSFGEHTFSVAMKFGAPIGSKPLPGYDQFQWGGFLQQSGYATGQLLGQNIQFGRLMYYRRIMRGSLLEGAYGGLSLEVGRVGDPLVAGSPEGLLKSAAIWVGADTPLGPVYLGYGQSADRNQNLYFYLGRPF
jgi:NTE family protein